MQRTGIGRETAILNTFLNNWDLFRNLSRQKVFIWLPCSNFPNTKGNTREALQDWGCDNKHPLCGKG